MTNPAEEDKGAALSKPTSAEGLRLIEAFLQISEPAKRNIVIELAEQFAGPPKRTER